MRTADGRGNGNGRGSAASIDKIDVIVVAGGAGVRLGMDRPKAFVPLAGMPLVAHSLRFFAEYPRTGTLVCVVPAENGAAIRGIAAQWCGGRTVVCAPGGRERWQSVRNGVHAVRDPMPWCLVHDAARPFVTTEVTDALVEKAARYQCVVTATPEVDTLRRVEGDRALETLDRSRIVRIGTPQLFLRESLLRAYDAAGECREAPTDEACLMERAGIAIGIARGDPRNFKITTKANLETAELLARERS